MINRLLIPVLSTVDKKTFRYNIDSAKVIIHAIH